MFLLSLLIFLIVVVMAFLLAGDYAMFVNVPSLIIVIPPAVIFAAAATSFKALKDGLSVMTNDHVTLGKVELLTSKRAYITLGNTAMLTGWLGVVIGIVAIASNVEPEVFKDVIGPATAVCMLTLLYALLLKVPCYLIEQKLLNELEVLDAS